MRILIVDNDDAQRKKLKQLATSWGYNCITAETADDAVKIVAENKADTVLVHWNEPFIDGPALCEKVRTLDDQFHTYCILYSESGTVEDLALGIDKGADDFIAIPFEDAELKARLKAGMRIVALDQSLMSAKARLERGLTQAARTLKSMLPQRRDGRNFKIDWLFRPCSIIGGDLFNVLDLDDEHICLYAIDVSGHEVAAALFAVTLGHMLLPRQQVRSSDSQGHPPRFSWNQSPLQVVSTLNNRFQMEPPMNMYATLFYGVIDRKDLTLRWVRAGHPSPLIIRKGEIIVLEEGDTPIGVFSDSTFTQRMTQLEPGDRLLLYSDGITEARHPSNEEMWGLERLKAMMTDLADRPFDSVVPLIDQALLAFRGCDQFEDDLSLLALEIK